MSLGLISEVTNHFNVDGAPLFHTGCHVRPCNLFFRDFCGETWDFHFPSSGALRLRTCTSRRLSCLSQKSNCGSHVGLLIMIFRQFCQFSTGRPFAAESSARSRPLRPKVPLTLGAVASSVDTLISWGLKMDSNEACVTWRA